MRNNNNNNNHLELAVLEKYSSDKKKEKSTFKQPKALECDFDG